MKLPRLPLELRVALLYSLFGGLWILFSDSLLEWLVQDPHLLTDIQTVKGWAYVAASAALIYFLLRPALAARARAEADLLQSREHYRQFFETSHDAVLLTTPDGGILAANPAACRMFGRSEAELIELGRGGVTDPADPRLPAALEERARTGRFVGELTFLRKDGQKFPGEIASTVITDSQGQTRTSMLIRDISERKQAEARVLWLNRLYATLSQISQVVVHARDRETLFDGICRAAIESGKYRMAWVGLVDRAEGAVKPAAFAGEEQGYLAKVRILYHDVELGRGPTGTAVREGRCAICQDMAADPRMAPWREPALQRGYLSSAAVPIRQNGAAVGAFTVYAGEAHGFDLGDEKLLSQIGEDVSFALDALEAEAERRRAEDEVARLNAGLEQRVAQRTRQLAEANQELEAFAYSVSHDLRAPLRVINGWSQVLLEDYAPALDEQGRRSVEAIRAETARMSLLIESLLHLSRVSRAEMKHETVDLSALAGQIAARLQREQPRQGVETRIQPGLFARGDSALLEIALTNLLSNAWKFTARRADACIEFGQAEARGEKAYFVRDNGVGFDMAHASRLFGVFQRLHREADFAGTGIGLALVQRIVQRHGGQVWAEGGVNQGAVFYFTLEERND